MLEGLDGVAEQWSIGGTETERLEGSRFSPLSDRTHDRLENHGATQSWTAGGSRERLSGVASILAAIRNQTDEPRSRWVKHYGETFPAFIPSLPNN